jgi:hypothetical protein
VIADLSDESASLREQSFADFYRRGWRPVVCLGYVLTGNRHGADRSIKTLET